jgi:SAM-dependent methyltransferase
MKYNHPRFLFRRFVVMSWVKKNDHFLEIGPGKLSLALDLLTKFNRGTLIDFNTTDVETTYEKLPILQKKRLKLIIADFSEYNQFAEKFDCVISCDVLEHIKDDTLFLKKTNDLLNEGGQLIISVPARNKYWSKDDELVGHYRRYEKQELIDKLTEAGFTEIKIASYGYPFINITRLGRILLARIQYSEKSKWGIEKRSQESAFFIKDNSRLDWLAFFLNKYTLLPLNIFASIFNNLDLSEGYVATAQKMDIKRLKTN